MKSNTQKIISDLLNYDRFLHEKDVNFVERGYSNLIEANKLLQNEPNAFLFGVIFDQGIPAIRAWSAPFFLKQRLGNDISVSNILKNGEEKIVEVCKLKPSLHRYNYMGKWIYAAALLLKKKYSSNAENIWNHNKSAIEIIKNLQEFKGIGQKKSNMATLLLYRDLNIKMKDLCSIDIAYDVHVRRVLLRTGIAEKDDLNHMIGVVRKLNPEFPARLDGPLWHIGRNWCHSQKPNCKICFLKNSCNKFVLKNIKSQK